MKFLCDSRRYFLSLINQKDKNRFMEKYFNNKTFSQMPIVETSIYDCRTIEQNHAIWRDMGIVASLMYTDKETVYYWLLKAECLKDIWLEEATYGKDKKQTFRFKTLSGLSKKELTEAIPRFRDYMQELVNKEYQQYVIINWSNKENMYKPAFEFQEP